MNISFEIDACKVPVGMQSFEISDRTSIFSTKLCPVCASSWKETVRLKCSEGEAVLSRGYCEYCGYLGVYNSFTPAWLEKYYSTSWTNSPETEAHERTSEQTNEAIASFAIRHLPKRDSSILDVGAGFGSSLRGLIKHGYTNLQALELSERRYRVLKDRYPSVKLDHVPIQKLNESKVLSKEFDLVYLSHVLEHLSDLDSCLKTLNSVIKDGGFLYIAVPHFQEEHLALLLNLHVHLHTFQPQTLRFLMSRYGFSFVEESTNFDSSGIKMLFRKTGGLSKGEATILSSPNINRNVYHEKVFRDFCIMHLAHDAVVLPQNILLGAHATSTFAGSLLLGYPISAYRAVMYRLWVAAHNARAKKVNFFTRAGTFVTNKLTHKMNLPFLSILLTRVQNLPSADKLRNLFNQSAILEVDFVYPGKQIKAWIE